jgi:hypothetical protein
MRTMVAICGAVAGAISFAVAVHGCAPMPSDDCAARNRCAPPGDDASDANEDSSVADIVAPDSADGTLDGDGSTEGGDAADGAACDPTKSPRDEPCLLDESYGVFVAASGGSDTSGNGSRAKPFATIGHALGALGAKRRLYICAGTYSEYLTLEVAANLYGGLACPGMDAGTDWSYLDGGLAKVSGAANQVPLTVSGVDAAISIEDLWVAAANASGHDDAGNGQSSVAALVNASTVTFRRCALSAGTGAGGADGTTGGNYAGTSAPAGQANDGGLGGAGGSNACNDGTSSTGGPGGSSTSTVGGDGGAQPMPAVSAPFDGIGAMGGTATCGAGGDPGANASAGGPGLAATTFGTLTGPGWIPGAGGTGANGLPGQGGGGGGGKSLSLTGGTGGGAGGCGGAGGTGGGGGGASIALACTGSVVALEGCVLMTSDAGAGGKGGDGQLGQGGGSSPAVVGACSGGFGGNGAGGAGGAGGTGGVSACIVYRGAAPSGPLTCTHGSAGLPGALGRGGDGGDNSPSQGNPGVAGPNGADGGVGVSQDSLAIP